MQRFAILGLAGVMLLAGCSSGDENQAAPHLIEPQSTDAVTPLNDDMPDQDWAKQVIAHRAQWTAVTAKPVWATLDGYADCAPSTLPITSQQGPHTSQAYHVTVNAKGYSPFKSMTTPLPVGTVIVKEKYADIKVAKARNHLDALGVMNKREPGYDPAHGDWEYGYIELDADGQIESVTRGRVKSCIECHSKQAEDDYVFRSYPLMLSPK